MDVFDDSPGIVMCVYGQFGELLMMITTVEDVECSEEGIAALVFSAEGDMRQAINNLQSTVAGFGFVSGDNVFKVVDSPHPIAVQAMIKACMVGKIDQALETLDELWAKGYSAVDIISTMFRVTKSLDGMAEQAKLEFIRVCIVSPHVVGMWLTFCRRLASLICACLRVLVPFFSSRAAWPGYARSIWIRNCSRSEKSCYYVYYIPCFCISTHIFMEFRHSF